MYRTPQPAPQSTIPEDRRGPVVGRFCKSCGSTFSKHQSVHEGKGVYSKDHVSSTCVHEGDLFAPDEDWWEMAVEVLAPEAAPEDGEADSPS